MEATDRSPTDQSLRAKRSRKDRPCDHCRRLKHACKIITRGEPCDNCVRGQRACTFDGPPLSRLREPAAAPSTDTFDRVGGSSHASSQAGPSGEGRRPQYGSMRGTVGALSVLEALDMSDDETDINPNESAYFAPLDTEPRESEELHYLGAGVFSHSVIELSQLDVSTLSPLYRQVASPQQPVFFLRNPSRIYESGNAALEAREAYERVTGMLETVERGLPHRLIKIFIDTLLPAYPIMSAVRLEAACQAWQGGGPFPHALLVGIMAFAAVSVPICRNRCKELWGNVVRLLENEYRQPRLQTLQLALLDIGGRPVLNPGGNHMAIARAIGAAQLLGLHRDCSRWRLPSWERSIRKRLWWTLYITDKWNAFLFGRPSNTVAHHADVPMLRIQDDDWHGENPLAPGLSSFIFMCRMAVILDSLLPVVDLTSIRPVGARLIIQEAAKDLERVSSDMEGMPMVPGMNDAKLTQLGMSVLICRLAFDTTVDVNKRQLSSSIARAVLIVNALTQFVSELTLDDFGGYWSTSSSFLLSQSLCLLLKLALRLHRDHPQELETLSQLFSHAIQLARAIERTEPAWEVAQAALPTIRSVISSLPPIPGSGEIRAIGQPGNNQLENGLPLEVQSWLDSFDFTGGEMDLWLQRLMSSADPSVTGT